MAKGNPDYDGWTKCGAKHFDAAKKDLGLKAYFAHSVSWETRVCIPADGRMMPTVMNSALATLA